MGEVVMLHVVTGAEGFLGRRLVERLSSEGLQVLAVDRQAHVGREPPGVQYHLSDLTDPDTLIPPSCEPIGRFLLVHLAWDMRRRERSYGVQSEQVTRLGGVLDTWQDRGLAYVIAPGSAQEYGALGGRIVEEAAPVEPLSPYGWAKRAASLMASSWSLTTGVGVLWLRPFIIYGPGQVGSMLVPYAIRQGLAGESAAFSDGTQVRDFVYVDDVIEAILAGIRRQPAGSQVVNLGSRDPVSIRELLGELARLLNAGDQFTFGKIPRRPGEPDEQVADVTRARELLGWCPTVGWKEGLARVCASIVP